MRIANERVAISLAYLARLSHSSPTSAILDIRVSRYSTRININRTDRHLLAALSGGAGEEGGGNAGKTERVRPGVTSRPYDDLPDVRNVPIIWM